MRARSLIAAALLAVAVAACGDDKVATLPAPREPGPDAIGTVCRMALSEHTGPKGQVFIGSQDAPLWFSSVRDTFTWLLVDDGAGGRFAAIYVNDMGRSANWEKPDADAWVEARTAHFVVGSDRGAAMGGGELVPFSDRGKAEEFAGRHGGKVIGYAQISRDLLAQGDGPSGGNGEHAGGTHHGSGKHHE